MKIGNIKQIVEKIVSKERTIEVDGDEYYIDFERRIRKLPMQRLERSYQDRFNKHLDYGQWVGIRDELAHMGDLLLSDTLSILGDCIFVIQSKNEKKILELESNLKAITKEKEKLQEELKKYID